METSADVACSQIPPILVHYLSFTGSAYRSSSLKDLAMNACRRSQLDDSATIALRRPETTLEQNFQFFPGQIKKFAEKWGGGLEIQILQIETNVSSDLLSC